MVEKTNWIEWNGEDRLPVLPKTIVDVQFRSGDVSTGHRANEWEWCWFDEEEDGDIVRYRVWHDKEEE